MQLSLLVSKASPGLSLAFAILLVPSIATAQEIKLTASDGATGDRFGMSVAMSGDVAIVGAPKGGNDGSRTGSAYVYRWDGDSWIEEQKLLASDGEMNDSFGMSMAISNDVLLVGAAADGDNGLLSGSAYVFRWNGTKWVQEQKLLAGDGQDFDFFGGCVDVDGDVAVVGAAEGGFGTFSSPGSAYVLRWNGRDWVQEQKLVASDGQIFDNFGLDVAVSGDVIVVGNNVNAVYVFRNGGSRDSPWFEEQKLITTSFARSVAIEDGMVLVGTPAPGTGSVNVFRWNGATWAMEDNLLASDAANKDWFGVSVALAGDRAVVGAYWNDDNGSNSGSAYTYRWMGTNWVEEEKLLPSDGAVTDLFGVSVGASGERTIVGATYDDDSEMDSGSAYIYQLEASCTFRNGSGVNSTDYFCVTNPILGEEWTSVIDAAPSLGLLTTATAVVFGFGGPASGVFLPDGGELLIAPPAMFDLAVRARHSIPIPADSSLAGQLVSTQGIRFEAGPSSVVLLNAQDLVLGF